MRTPAQIKSALSRKKSKTRNKELVMRKESSEIMDVYESEKGRNFVKSSEKPNLKTYDGFK